MTQDAEPLAIEQAKLDELYARVDALREESRSRLAQMRLTRVGGHHQNRSERDAFAQLYEDQIIRLDNAEDKLCFGRLDLIDSPEPLHIGRIGVSDEEHHSLLVDWRAPASERFYQATGAHPQGVSRRRHITTRMRRVTAVEDDVLDLEQLSADERRELSGEGALLAALEERRTGHMGDIVATIQAEQDRIIRLPRTGTVVVQGGPGTGKTAVALHRAAYLIYQHRERIEASGILLVGPSSVFLRYIEKVLPSLGETGAVPLTPGRLFPGVDATAQDTPEIARIKGSLAMVPVLRRAVALRQRVPSEPQTLRVNGQDLTLTPEMVRRARERARRTGQPHNEARVTFVKTLLRQLGEQLAAGEGAGDPDDLGGLVDDVRRSRDARIALNLAWMPLSPQGVLNDLLSKPKRLHEAFQGSGLANPGRLLRDADAPLTVDDVPLLDELAELIGEEPRATGTSRTTTEEREYADAVVSMTGTGTFVDAEDLAERWAHEHATVDLADRAMADRTWTFGHMVVDEAQELSPMQLRLLFRRVPSKSATLVGDLAQRSRSGGAGAWAEMLTPHLGDRWEAHELTISYRTPRQILDLANALLAERHPGLTPPRGVREGEAPPEVTAFADHAAVRRALPGAIAALRSELPGARLAVIAPSARTPELRDLLETEIGEADVSTPGEIDAPISVLDPIQAKGLEFDAVVVIEPGEINPPGSDSGLGDLYVALTRSTQRLTVLGSGASPLDGLEA